MGGQKPQFLTDFLLSGGNRSRILTEALTTYVQLAFMPPAPIFEKKNVLVTGGAGFIGSFLCERLLRDSKVICLDNFSTSQHSNISHLLKNPDFEFIRADVNSLIDLAAYPELERFKVRFQGVQEVYHLACPTSPKNFDRL